MVGDRARSRLRRTATLGLEAENAELRRQCTGLASALKGLIDAVSSTEVAHVTADGQLVRQKLMELPEVRELDVPLLLLPADGDGGHDHE